MTQPLCILHLEDEANVVELTQSMLEAEGIVCKVERVETREGFSDAVSEGYYDLIFADYSLPQFDGLSALEIAKEQCPDTPFIFISGKLGEESAIESLKSGATDYVLKQRLSRLIPSVHRALRESESKLEKKKLEKKLHKMAYYDALTGLPNRPLLEERIDQCIKRMNREKDYVFAVLFLDLDRFKQVNDSFGHHVGDDLLVAVAEHLVDTVREEDTVARLGGDEFAILLNDIRSSESIAHFTQRILERLQLPLQLKGRELYTSPSIGVATSTSDHVSSDDILRDADIAMYVAKDTGRGCYKFYDPSIRDKIIDNLALETDLRTAIEKKQLELFYQPIILLKTGEIKGFEALLRWHHPERGDVPPDRFISIAEESGSILPIGEWVLSEACAQTYEWNKTLNINPPLFISVNVSSRQADQSGFVDSVDKILIKTKLSPALLKLELTENAIIDRYRNIHKLFAQFQERSIQISLDDFGTGYSSLSHLHEFPVDTVKIDRSFVSPSTHSTKNDKIVQAIIALSESLDMSVVAEGIETREQLEMLVEAQCKYGQGFLMSEPVNKEEAVALLKKGKVF